MSANTSLDFGVVFFEKKAGKWESLSRNCQYNSWNLFSDNPKYGNFSGIPHSLNEKFFVTLGKNRAPVVCSPRVT